MSRSMFVFALFSLVLAACGQDDAPTAGNAANNEATDAGCPTCPACPDAGVCPTCPEPPAPALAIEILGVTYYEAPTYPVPTLHFNGRYYNNSGMVSTSWTFGPGTELEMESGTGTLYGADLWEADVPISHFFAGRVGGSMAVGFFNVNATDTGGSASAHITVTLTVESNIVSAFSGRLTVNFAANTPSGQSAPAYEETMIKAILSASMEEDIQVDTLTFRVSATSPGLDNWELRWDDGPPGNTLDLGMVPNYSGGWATITAHVNMELYAGSNMAVSLYMNSTAMRTNDVVSLQISGASGTGVSSGAAVAVSVPTDTKVHTY